MDPCVTTAPAILFRIHTDRSTPTPAKTMVVGVNACQINMRVEISDERISYQANGSNCLGKGKEYVYRRIEPFCPSCIGTLGLI